MGHILFGAPSLAHYHLHDQLAAALKARGHRVTFLAPDALDFEFYSSQGQAAHALRRGAPLPTHVPIREFALVDCLLAGHASPRARRWQAAARGLARRVAPLRHALDRDPPDLMLLHQGRGGLHRLLHYVARECGTAVLHTGAGLLPHTIQWDTEGLDGDAAACRRRAIDYRRAKNDPALVERALSAWLAGATAPAVVRSAPGSDSWRGRLAAGTRHLLRGDVATARRALGRWRDEVTPFHWPPDPPVPPPRPPFIAVLLQTVDCPRVRLDAPPGTRSVDLALAAARVAPLLDPRAAVVALLPEAGLPHRERGSLARAGVLERPLTSAPQTLSTALAVVTVNHPLGIGALLAGTPLLHTGRTPYDIPGVSTRTTLDRLEHDMAKALALQTDTLRQRFLTRYLGTDHVWCSVDAPDPNGLRGLVARVEKQMREPGPMARGPGYRAGPVWPLERLK